jgi:hypothetical protein
MPGLDGRPVAIAEVALLLIGQEVLWTLLGGAVCRRYRRFAKWLMRDAIA